MSESDVLFRVFLHVNKSLLLQSSSNYPAPQDEFGFEINDNQGGGQVEEAVDEPDDMSNLRATDEPAQGHVFDDDGVLQPLTMSYLIPSTCLIR